MKGWLARAVVITAAVVHALTLPAVATAGQVLYLWLAVPGLATVLLVPGAWRHSLRWLTLWALVVLAVYPDAVVLVMAVGQAWALWRAWLVEADGRPGMWWRRRSPEATA